MSSMCSWTTRPWPDAAANVNVDLAYAMFGGMKIVIAIDDLDSARAALQ